MHSKNLDRWTHEHVFLSAAHHRNEWRIWIVVAITAAMMIGEIAGGTIYGSLALVADGWHMATHTVALGISALAYFYARRHRNDSRFSFGTGKFGELAAFASAIVLAMVAVMVAYESILRIAQPVPIAYGEAVAIAAVGLLVNLASAWLLRDDHTHGHTHHRSHDEDRHCVVDHGADDHGAGDTHAHPHHPHHDHNLRAAYIHVLADALTSVLAILALSAAWAFGWNWADPAVGIVGATVIASWAYGLLRDAAAVLLDVVPDQALEQDICRRLETGSDRLSDLHLWQVGPGHFAAVVAIVTDRPRSPDVYKSRLASLSQLSHVTVEVSFCSDHTYDQAA
jgi:cation diffusion facilitator family transporter